MSTPAKRSQNLILGVGLATVDGVPFSEDRQRIALIRLQHWLQDSISTTGAASSWHGLPDITLTGSGRYTNEAGITFTEPCLSLVWYGRGDDDWFIEAVRRAAVKWCELFEQESFALTVGTATIHNI